MVCLALSKALRRKSISAHCLLFLFFASWNVSLSLWKKKEEKKKEETLGSGFFHQSISPSYSYEEETSLSHLPLLWTDLCLSVYTLSILYSENAHVRMVYSCKYVSKKSREKRKKKKKKKKNSLHVFLPRRENGNGEISNISHRKIASILIGHVSLWLTMLYISERKSVLCVLYSSSDVEKWRREEGGRLAY